MPTQDINLRSNTEIPLDSIEDPLFLTTLEYWRSRIEAGFAPSWTDLDLLALPTAIVPYVTVVDVVDDPFDFVYRFFGTGHVEAKGIDRTGARVTDHPQGRGHIVFTEYKAVYDEKRPVAFQRKLLISETRLPLLQTSLRMPLTSDGETVDKIIAISNWYQLKEFWPIPTFN